MIKHEEISNPNSCLNRAANDEPVFVLRANDELAPNVVRSWAVDYLLRKSKAGALTDKQKAKYDEACLLADAMEEWKRSHP